MFVFSSLKHTLKKTFVGDTLDLCGVPLSSRDVQRVVQYLHGYGSSVAVVDLSFTELQDDGLRVLLPALCLLPRLSTLALNGNQLTSVVLKDLTEVLKDPKKFPKMVWIDLGNNVNIFSLPQPLLVALRRRVGLRSSLPTIHEHTHPTEEHEEQLEEDITLQFTQT